MSQKDFVIKKEDNSVKVSVILPIYNAERTLQRCVDSVLAQTFRDFELICIDDGSKDQSAQICQNYVSGNTNLPQIKLIVQENQGVVAARNNGLKSAKGKYVAFLDSDDEYDPNMLCKMVQAMEESESDICVCGYTCIGHQNYDVRPSSFCISSSVAYVDALFHKAGVQGFLWNKMYRKELFDNVIKNPPKMTLCEDLYINCMLSFDVKKAVSIDACLYKYYTNPESASNAITRKIDENGDWKYLKAYESIVELFSPKSKSRKIAKEALLLVYLYGVKDLEPYKKEYADTYNMLLKKMKKNWLSCMFSKQPIRFKKEYSKMVVKRKAVK